MSPFSKLLEAAVQRIDGWGNTITGVGTSRDKMAAARMYQSGRLMESDLDRLYDEDDFAATIVEALPEDGMRQGWEPVRRASEDDLDESDGAETKERIAAIKRRAVDLGVDARVMEGAIWGRLHGGSAVIPIVEDGLDPSMPLDIAKVRAVRSLITVSRWELSWHAVNDDPRSSRYGKPETWLFQPINGGQGMVIHSSRLLTFEGSNVSRRRRIEEQGWSVSVLQRVYEILRDAGMNWKSISYILNDASQPVFKMKNLISMIAGGQKEALQNRMEVVNMARSAARALLVDADGEDFEYRSGSLAGLDVLLDKTWVRVAAAARMPVTRLMGMSPAGMNATGESDVRGWYDSVQSYRTTDLQLPLEVIVRLIAAELTAGSPDEWTIEWPSLWQMTPTEEAAHRKTIADTDSIYIDKGVVTPEEVTATRFGGGTYSDGPITVDLSLRDPASQPMAPAMPVGTRVTVDPANAHMEGATGPGVVREVRPNALGIEFDSAPGMIHRWYTADEVNQAEAPTIPGSVPVSVAPEPAATGGA